MPDIEGFILYLKVNLHFKIKLWCC